MKLKVLLLFLFAPLLSEAQTKLISHKSHSGSKHSFSKAYEENLFDINCSNFGLPGSATIVVVDTIMAINDSVTVVKTKESSVCYPYGMTYKDLKASDFKSKPDTIINHELLYKDNSAAIIKCADKYKFPFWFQNPVKNIVLIGFEE